MRLLLSATLVFLAAPSWAQRALTEAESRAALAAYGAQDQHDVLALKLQEVLGEIAIEAMESPRTAAKLKRFEEAYANGAMPEAQVAEMRWKAALCELEGQTLELQAEAIRKKLSALESLSAGDLQGFWDKDIETNALQLEWFQNELKQVQVTEAYWENRHKKIQSLAGGMIPKAKAEEIEIEWKKSQIHTVTWKAKVAEAAKQLDSAKAEAKKTLRKDPSASASG